MLQLNSPFMNCLYNTKTSWKQGISFPADKSGTYNLTCRVTDGGDTYLKQKNLELMPYRRSIRCTKYYRYHVAMMRFYFFTTASRLALDPTQPAIQCVPVALSLGVKRPGGEADHSPPSSVEVKNTLSYTHTPQYAFMKWSSVKAQGKLTQIT